MMDQESVQKIINATSRVRMTAALALGMLALFLLIATVGELKGLEYIGAGIQPTDTITVSGEGKVFAIPDTATFTYTVDETAADVASAQAKATTASNAVISYLTGQGVASTDIQTTDYNVNPQYSYSTQVCAGGVYCPPQNQTITGYEVSETESVKVEDITKAGTLLSGVGTHGVSDVSGLTFTVKDETTLDAQARDMAIKDAQTKAQALAKSLGVSIVSVVGYNENSGGIAPQPIYAKFDAAGATASSAAVAPDIATGQNTIISDVNVTYEIR